MAASAVLSKVGARFPSVVLTEGKSSVKVALDELLSGKRVVIFAVPGAFTPGCSKTHLPGYVADYEKYKLKGVDEIVCTSVNDAFVMAAWGDALGATGKIRMLADADAVLARTLGVDWDASGGLGFVRSRRWSALVEDGTVKAWNLEPPEGGLTCSLSGPMLSIL